MQTRAKRGGRGAQRVKHARGVRHVQGEDDIFLLFLALSLARLSLLTLASCLPSFTRKHKEMTLVLQPNLRAMAN